jgi:putative transposase
MVERDNSLLSIQKQCDLLSLAESSFYYNPVPVSEKNQLLMRATDRLYTAYPVYGYRRMTVVLNRLAELPSELELLDPEDREAWPVIINSPINPKRIRRLYREMALEAIYPKPNLSRSNMDLKEKHPYLLRDLDITHPNQVWAVDITYIPMRQGHLYLYTTLDLYSRMALSHSLSNTMHVEFCTECLEDAIVNYGVPEIHNSDQGSQFTCKDYLGVLKNHNIRISMDGRGRALDNVFVERFWRTVKYEEVYIKKYDDAWEAEKGIERFIKHYNESRPHSSLEARTASNKKTYLTPKEAYLGQGGTLTRTSNKW